MRGGIGRVIVCHTGENGPVPGVDRVVRARASLGLLGERGGAR